MKWDLHIFNPTTQKSAVKVMDFPMTTKADQGAVARMAGGQLKIDSDRILAMPHNPISKTRSGR